VGAFAANLLQLAFLAIWLLVLGRVFLSWFDPAGRSQLGSFLITTTEPLLAPIRRVLPDGRRRPLAARRARRPEHPLAGRVSPG
jgi:uncharacterized protein YggT (Ycf19 family)